MPTALTRSTYRSLNNGSPMPVIGLGVWKAGEGREVEFAVRTALEAGYRLFDTAKIYGNEAGVGKAVRDSDIPREDIFVTTKLWRDDMGYKIGLQAFDASLQTLGLDYVDLYLIHWPVTDVRRDAWRALEEIYHSGRAKAIGVSNYTVRHLEEMREYAAVIPAVNQVEFHPFLFQKELLTYCQKQGIQLEAYSPLVHGDAAKDNEVLEKIAAAYGKSVAQVMLRWSLQHGTVVIPKSVHAERIKENIDIFDFELSPPDMAAIDGLNRDYRTCWDPTTL